MAFKYRMVLVMMVVATAGAWFVYFGSFFSPPSPDAAPAAPASESRACSFTSRYGLRLDCYWVPVGEGRVQARLSAAIFRAESESAARDPLVYIAGGPGEAGNTEPESLAVWDLWLAETALGRDFVLLDLRGLSPSEPAWDCAEYTQQSRELLSQNLTFAEEAEVLAPVLLACLAKWQESLARTGGPVASLDAFSSQLNVADLGMSLRRLGYNEWNYLAASYGTRVALLAAMQQPEVRRVILDSPYPPERGSLSDSLVLWRDAFARYWHRCEKISCEFSQQQFWQLMADLQREPVWVEVEDWRTGRMEKWLLNEGRLAAALYTTFYSSELTSMLASALHQYVEGDPQPLTRILEIFFNQVFDSRFNSAIFWATECNDNFLEGEASFAQTLATLGPWQRFFAADWQYNLCRAEAFRPGQLPPMVAVSAPVLVAAGELDPITTAEHARALMNWLPNGKLLVQEDRSHAEFFMSHCGQGLIAWFLQATSAQLAEEWLDRSAACHLPTDGREAQR